MVQHKAFLDRALSLFRRQRAVHASGHPAHSPRGPKCWSCGCRGCSQECGVKLGVSLVLICCIVLVALTFDVSKLEGLLMWVKENKVQGSLLFLTLYTLAIVLMVPAMVMAMCAGAIFGALAGTLIVWVGSSVGQVMAFMVGRYLLREMVLRYLTEAYPKWSAIDRALEREGWKLVTLLRLSPIAPWNILNYALAVTAMPLGPYALASSLAVLPYLVMFVYLGSLARTLSDIFGGLAGPDTGTTILLGAISGVLMVAIVWWTTQMAKKAISEALVDEADGPIAEGASAEINMLCMLRRHQGADALPDSAGGDPDGDPEAAQLRGPGGRSGGGDAAAGESELLLLPAQRQQQNSSLLAQHATGHLYGRTDGRSPRGGVAATVRLVGGGGVGEQQQQRQQHELQLTPLLPAKDVVVSTPRGGDKQQQAEQQKPPPPQQVVVVPRASPLVR